MKLRTKSTKTAQVVSSLQNKKSVKKSNTNIKSHINVIKINADHKKTGPNSQNNRHNDRIGRTRHDSLIRHNMSQSQLNNQSVSHLDKDAQASSNQTKSKNHSTQYNSNKIKNEAEIKSNLLQTFKILEHRLKLKHQNTSQLTTLGLSKSIYEIIKNSTSQIGTKQNGGSKVITMNSFNNSGAELVKQNKENIEKQENKQKQENKYQQENKQNKKPKHSGSLIDYFQEKFGSTSAEKNAEGLQKKLRILQVLKKSQEVASKCSTKYNISSNSGLSQIRDKDSVRQILKEKAKVLEL